jgi:hypothetical protein
MNNHFRRFQDENGKCRFSVFTIVAFVFGGFLLAALFAFLFGWIVMLLWNWLMPDIFGLPLISYWQAWGLVLLSHILVKSGYGHGDDHHHRRDRDREWKERVRPRSAGEEAAAGPAGAPDPD